MRNNWSFQSTYKTVTAAMIIIRTYPFIPRNKTWLLQVLGLTVINTLCLIFLTNSIFLHDAKSGKYADASKNFAMLIVCFNSNMKYYTMLYYRDSIADLIKIINSDYEEARELNEENSIILSYVGKARKISKIWACIAVCTSAIFPVKAFYLMSYYYSKGEKELVPMFELTFPNFIERHKPAFWAYLGIFGLCFIFDTFACLVYMGFEPLIPIFTLHVCGQLQSLSLRIRKIISESESEQEMKEKFNNVNKKLQELYSFIGHVQNNFMFLMEFNMKTTTLVLPCNAFLLVQDFCVNNTINVEYIFLTVASVVHFYSPCYFCDLLIESSENFRQAIYSCGWESIRYMSIRKTVILMLIRAGKPFNISTIFYPISLDTFSTMCRQAYAIFNLMNRCLDIE